MRPKFLIFFIILFTPLNNHASFDLDIDDNGSTDALTDGLLTLRYMFGLSDESLTVGVIGNNANRTSPQTVESYLQAAGNKLDIDGDEKVDALTDGLLILRDLFGLTGESLVTGVLSSTSERQTSTEIIDYIASIKDSDNDDVVDSLDALPFDPTETLDTDGDSIGNNADNDDDGDGVTDGQDPAPLNPEISDSAVYAALDTDGDGIINKYDADDDSDGILDSLDIDPSLKEMRSKLSVSPWINEFKLSFRDVETREYDKLQIEVAKWGMDSCDDIVLHPFDASGQSVGNFFSSNGERENGLALSHAVGWYRGNTGCEGVWLTNNYDFISVNLRHLETYDGVDDLDKVVGVYLTHKGECVEIFNFNNDVMPENNVCDSATHFNITSPLNLEDEVTIARSGVGNQANDFTNWYLDHASGTVSSGWTPYRNNYQNIVWSAPESIYSPNSIEFGVLEIPKPRSSVVKSLQDSGWNKPVKSGERLEIFQVDEVQDQHIQDDGESTYVFASEKIRPDYLDFVDFMLGKFIGFMGSVRAENYTHHFDYPESSALLNDIAFQRGNYDAKSCSEENGGPQFFSTGSGGGYWGAAEEGYLNDQNPHCYRDEEGEERRIYSSPIRNFDASYGGQLAQDWPENILTLGSEIDLGAQSEPAYGGTRPGKFRDELIGGHMHEWAHNWESFHTIVYSEVGPKRFSHPTSWAESPIMHGLSIPFELYVREYIIHDEDYDNTQKLWSLKKHDERDIVNNDFFNVDYLTEFRAGNQGVELVWSAYLIKQFGLEKMYSEYYRRLPSSGDFRIALHQTYGKTFDDLLKDAASWAETVESHEDFRLLFDSSSEFIANLNQSFNVSLLQLRNISTPNNRYQTIYTYIGEGLPTESDSWIAITYPDDQSLIFSENTEAVVTRSESGQLQINGHDAYYYSGDESIFHAGGLAVSSNWSAFTRYGERTSDLWFPVFIYDHDSDGLPDDYDPDYLSVYFTDDGRYKLDVWPIDDGFEAPGQVSATAFSESE